MAVEDKNIALRAAVTMALKQNRNMNIAQFIRDLRGTGCVPDLPTDRTIYRAVERIGCAIDYGLV